MSTQADKGQAAENAAADDLVLSAFSQDPSNPAMADPARERLKLPLLGERLMRQHQRTLWGLLILGFVLLLGLSYLAFRQAQQEALQVAAVSRAISLSQVAERSVSRAAGWSVESFADLRKNSEILIRSLRGLQGGDAELRLDALGINFQDEVVQIGVLTSRLDRNFKTVVAQQEALTSFGKTLGLINGQSSNISSLASQAVLQKTQKGGGPAEMSAAGQLGVLAHRMGWQANEIMVSELSDPQLAASFGKSLVMLHDLLRALRDGGGEGRLEATKDSQLREKLDALLKLVEPIRATAGPALADPAALNVGRRAQAALVSDSDPLRQNLERMQDKLQAERGVGRLMLAALSLSLLLMLLAVAGLVHIQLERSRRSQALAEQQGREMDAQRLEARRINDANQAAILRLMNELQTVAEGDLTQQATVTEDITGAIADSVNYTVEELRQLVDNVQKTVGRVEQTTTEVNNNSTELLAASAEQMREIRSTGEAVLGMASRINNVSAQAQQSAEVARQSLGAAETGLQAVQNTIGGMNSIRDQIQETAKRIKRLGESSQEIGEITDLISDLTEETNVLALNAAIQAAAAGEAGRGFSVVAEEVQRLAERSGDATRQIAALVKTIQADTQDAVAAMERSTHGVVEGAKLSDSAGAALSEIDQVSRRLAGLIQDISAAAADEARSANVVVGNIQQIFAVSEQTSEGTRETARQVRELLHMAEELRQSVSRFKIA